MEDYLSLQLGFTEAKFLAEVADTTEAIAVDLETEEIVYATTAATKLFESGVKGGLIGLRFEELILEEDRPAHRFYFEEYKKNPEPREMGTGKGRLRAQTLKGRSFNVAIRLDPIKEYKKVFVILIFMRLPKEAK